MKRKSHISLVASTAILAVMSIPAFAQSRIDGASDVQQLENPTYDANTSLGVVSGDDLGNHTADRDLNMDGFAIFNLGAPSDPMDGVNMQYLQDYVSANGDNLGDHTATQVLDMDGFAIRRLPPPTAPDHATNRAYVDTAVAGAGDDLGNHTATENLNMDSNRIVNLSDPVNGQDAVNYSFLQSYVSANGDHLGNHTATQNLDMSGHKIENLQDPTADADGVNKLYVDTAVQAVQDAVDDVQAIRILAGTGLTGGGDLTQDRTLSFDTGWGDGRYALRSRTITAGAGLTGGGSLASNRTLALDTTFGDGRWVNRTGNESISGIKTFTGSVIVNSPSANTQAANKAYVDAAAASAPGTIYFAGSGLSLSGTTFSVDGTVVRTSGNQTISGTKTFNGWVVANTVSSSRYNTRGGQGLWMTAGESYNVVNSGNTGNGELIWLGAEGGVRAIASADNWAGGWGTRREVTLVDNNHESRFQKVYVNDWLNMTNGRIINLASPSGTLDAANKAYVDAQVAGAAYSAGTGLSLSGNTFSFDTGWGDGRYARRTRTISAGTGLTGGGNLAANRTINFDTGWGDGRYAMRSRSISAGTGLTGGGNLAANRTINFDTSWGDGRYARSSRTISSGTGLTGGGSLASNRTISLESNQVRRTAGDSSAGVMAYNGNSRSTGRFYGGSTNPNATTRLNYNGSLYATRFYSSSYYYFSDRNLKKDIETIEADAGMGIVRELRPVSYSWKQTGAPALGVIAQEVEEIVPMAVTTNEAGTKAVDYIQLIAPMLAAIQELDGRVQVLEDALQ